MAADRFSFTDKRVAALKLPARGQAIVRDADLPGFFILMGTRSKTYMVQADLWQDSKRRSIRIKVDDVGRLSAREARAKAKKLLGQIAEGVDPRPKPAPEKEESLIKGDPTLRQAWNSYRVSHMERKKRSEGTIENYRDHCERLMNDWLDQPLSMLGNDPSFVKERHDALTKENGPYIANGCMRSLRAIYNHARKANRSLPAENPVMAVDWNLEERRDTGMGLHDLPGWFGELVQLDNALRREFHLFLLLSGSRPAAIKSARRDHLDLRKRILHVPKPKGGEERAFDIPLSREMIRCLIRAIRIGRKMHPEQAEVWLFPAESETGHLVEHKEDRAELSKWGNDLRQSYRTIGQAAGVNEVDMHLLMNHSLPDVNAGYITRHKLLLNHLRQQQQVISNLVKTTLKPLLTKPGPVQEWLGWRSALLAERAGVTAYESRAIKLAPSLSA